MCGFLLAVGFPCDTSVAKMMAHVTEQARYSVDYDGQHDINVKRIRSDRDSDLTSNRAIAHMIAKKVEHIMTSSGAKNQTPTLDNKIRSVMRNARSILWCAGLKAEYGELAIRESVEIVNLLPCGRHKLGHSPMQQWEGKAHNVNRETFGADAYVKLEMDERADRDKLHEVAAGGNGRYRYVGTGTEIGHRAKGSLILDTTTGTLMHRRSYTLNENMAEVRALPFPKPAWPNVPDDELEGETLSESEETDFVDVEAPP